MKPTKAIYKVKLYSSPLIVRQKAGGVERIIYGNKNYISIEQAERIVSQLNSGIKVDFNDLSL